VSSGWLALVVGLAGALGAVCRYLADGAIGDRTSGVFPFGTLAVNAAGSLLLGLVTGLVLHHGVPAEWRLAVGVGFCGGLTTWSTASFETVRLAEEGALGYALAYALVGLAVSCAAGAAGLAMALI
jgi:CrcB protein